MLTTENRFGDLIQRLQFGVLIFSPAGDLITANDVAATVLGVTPEEFARRSLFDPSWTVLGEDGTPIEPEDRPSARLLATGEGVRDMVLGVRKPDSGEVVWLLVSVDALRNDGDEIDQVVCTFVDITDRQRIAQDLRIKEAQQEAVAALGQMALRGIPLDRLRDEATRRLADVLRVPFSTVLQREGDGRLRLLGGVGWSPDVIGTFVVEPTFDTQAGYTLLTQGPALVEDVETETRFGIAPVIFEHGISSALSVVIPGGAEPNGVMSVFSRESRAFSEEDIAFAQSMANVLGAVIERERVEAERDQAREQADVERARLRNLVARAPAAIALLRGPHAIYELINPRYVELLGNRDYIGRPAREVFAEMADSPLLQLGERVFTTGEPFYGNEFPVEIPSSPGQRPREYSLNLVIQPTFNAAGEVDGVISYAFDVTAQVVARRRAEHLAAQRDAILTQTAESVVIADADGRIVFANAAACAMLGQDPTGATLDRYPDAFRAYDEDGNQATAETTALGRALLHRESVLGAQRRVVRPDGTAIVAVGNAVPLFGEDGSFLGAVATYRDVTREHRMAQQKSDFLSAAAHDLKGPLTTIKGHAQLLLRRARRADMMESARVIADAERIEATATRMANLITELLDVTRIELGHPLDLTTRPVDLVPLVREVVDEQTRAGTDDRTVLEIESESLVGMWDELRLRRVVANLLSNALKYSPAGGTVTVRLSARESDGHPYAELEVCDTGIGIPEADLPHVFRRFYRAGNIPSGTEGSGIGLAGVRQIVEQLQGRVGIKSVEGQGTTVRVCLPLESSEEANGVGLHGEPGMGPDHG
jgi:PAS domain S-box-containing protein